MGDMSEYFLDSIMTYDELRLKWLTGEMSTEEAYEIGIIDELGFMDNEDVGFTDKRQTPVNCKYCGETGFYWFQSNTGYRLTKDGKTAHSCQFYKREVI